MGALRRLRADLGRHRARRPALPGSRGLTPERDGIFLARPPARGEGIPLAVKDLFDTAGLTTTYGSALFAAHVPTKTASAVERLEQAGYVNVGKTNLHEFAYGVTSENPHFGTVPNPVAPGRVAGGSSGGSAAALAAGLADLALGTDSGGSIRIPAACCGVVGFKPTFDLVPIDGVWPLAPTFDHAGPMARTVAGCESALAALVESWKSHELDSLADVRIVVARTWLDEADPLVGARVREASERFPHRRDVDFASAEGVGPLFQYEVAGVHRALYEDNAEAYGVDVARKIERCLRVSAREADVAAAARDLYREHALDVLGDADLVLAPTTPIVAPPVAEAEDDVRREKLIRFTFPINALGWPALALPCGHAEDGLPASVQLIGRPGADALVLAAGRLLEQAA